MLTRDRRAKNDLQDRSVVYSLAQELRCANFQAFNLVNHQVDVTSRIRVPPYQLILKLLGHSQEYFAALVCGCKGSFA